MSLQALPADLIKPVLEQLVDRTDLCHCTLVNQVFHQTATAVLYKHLEMYNIVLVSTTVTLLPIYGLMPVSCAEECQWGT